MNLEEMRMARRVEDTIKTILLVVDRMIFFVGEVYLEAKPFS